MNEPGLGQVFTQQISEFYERSVPLLGNNVTLAVNVIGGSFSVVDGANWMGGEIKAGKFPSNTLGDYHHYYTWDGQHDAGVPTRFAMAGWWAAPKCRRSSASGHLLNGDSDLHDLTNPSDVDFEEVLRKPGELLVATQRGRAYFWNFGWGAAGTSPRRRQAAWAPRRRRELQQVAPRVPPDIVELARARCARDRGALFYLAHHRTLPMQWLQLHRAENAGGEVILRSSS